MAPPVRTAHAASTPRALTASMGPVKVASRPVPRALGRVTAKRPERLREKAGPRASARAAPPAGAASHQAAKNTSRYSPQQMMAKAPVWESFRISSFRSRLWWEDRASQVSQKPSRWMPPLRAMGSSRARAAVKTAPNPSQPARASHSHSTAPTASPTSGNQHRAQERAFFSQSTRGMGNLEYMAKAMMRDFTGLLLSRRWGCRRPPRTPGRPAGPPPGSAGPARPGRPGSRGRSPFRRRTARW